MKLSILAELFRGYISCDEIPISEEMKQEQKQMVADETSLVNTFTKEQSVLYRHFDASVGQYHLAECESKFIAGFQIGLLIGLETAEENKKY